jgi:hypothetical protein
MLPTAYKASNRSLQRTKDLNIGYVKYRFSKQQIAALKFSNREKQFEQKPLERLSNKKDDPEPTNQRRYFTLDNYTSDLVQNLAAESKPTINMKDLAGFSSTRQKYNLAASVKNKAHPLSVKHRDMPQTTKYAGKPSHNREYTIQIESPMSDHPKPTVNNLESERKDDDSDFASSSSSNEASNVDPSGNQNATASEVKKRGSQKLVKVLSLGEFIQE